MISHLARISDGKVQIETRCPECKLFHTVEVNANDYESWKAGAHVQDAFPYMHPGVREQLVSGIDPVCWELIFGPPEEDEEDEGNQGANGGADE